MNTHIEQALYNFRVNGGRYARTARYYNGEHDLAFATEKFANTFGSLFREFSLNLCPAICDAIRDKLKIEGFSVSSCVSSPHDSKGLSANSRAHAVSRQPTRETDMERRLRSSPHCVRATDTEAADLIWHRNRMDVRAGEIHKEALTHGDAYAIVWPDANGKAAIFPNKASSITVEYDDEFPGKIVWAAKLWRTRDKFTRLNLFYPDRIERYISSKPSESTASDPKDFVRFRVSSPHDSKGLGANSQALTDVRATDTDWTIENPYGIVPVFHFANNASIGAFGRSELDDAIPVQDGMNKSVLDMLVAMEFSAYRQRWAAGIEVQYDNEGNLVAPFKAGVDHLWITENKDARFGDFEAANLDHFLKVKDGFRIDLASVTGTPLYYLLPHGRGFASGEAMRKAESRFIAKVRDRQTSFGQVWADVMQFALKIEGHGDVTLQTRWEDAARLSEKEELENLLLKKELGLSGSEALRELGYIELHQPRSLDK